MLWRRALLYLLATANERREAWAIYAAAEVLSASSKVDVVCSGRHPAGKPAKRGAVRAAPGVSGDASITLKPGLIWGLIRLTSADWNVIYEAATIPNSR